MIVKLFVDTSRILAVEKNGEVTVSAMTYILLDLTALIYGQVIS